MPNITVKAAILRGGPTVHAGPVNSGLVDALSWGGFAGWSSWGGGNVTNGTYDNRVRAVFDGRWSPDDDPWVTVACDSTDALVRFYEADGFVPIVDRSATGGAGAHLRWPFPRVGVNQGDSFQMTTSGETVLFFASLMEIGDSLLDPYLEGRVVLTAPSGVEEIPIERFVDEVVIVRSWSEPGEYRVELDQVNIGYSDFVGVLAGFRLVAQLGSMGEDRMSV